MNNTINTMWTRSINVSEKFSVETGDLVPFSVTMIWHKFIEQKVLIEQAQLLFL